MAGVLRWTAVFLAVLTVVKADILEDNIANPVEIANDLEDFNKDLEDIADQVEKQGKELARYSLFSYVYFISKEIVGN